MTLTVRYSCPLCGIKDAPVQVEERPSEMDVRVWMGQVIAAVSRDHALRSPWCHPSQLHDLKVPIAGAAFIGGPVQH